METKKYKQETAKIPILTWGEGGRGGEEGEGGGGGGGGGGSGTVQRTMRHTSS